MKKSKSNSALQEESPTYTPSLSLLVTLGSIAVHVDELFDNTNGGAKLEAAYTGAQADVIALPRY